MNGKRINIYLLRILKYRDHLLCAEKTNIPLRNRVSLFVFFLFAEKSSDWTLLNVSGAFLQCGMGWHLFASSHRTYIKCNRLAACKVTIYGNIWHMNMDMQGSVCWSHTSNSIDWLIGMALRLELHVRLRKISLNFICVVHLHDRLLVRFCDFNALTLRSIKLYCMCSTHISQSVEIVDTWKYFICHVSITLIQNIIIYRDELHTKSISSYLSLPLFFSHNINYDRVTAECDGTLNFNDSKCLLTA